MIFNSKKQFLIGCQKMLSIGTVSSVRSIKLPNGNQNFLLVELLCPENLDQIQRRSILAKFPALMQFKLVDSTGCVEGENVFSVL